MTTTPDGHDDPSGGQVERYVHRARLTNVDLAEQQRRCYELRLRHHTIREIAAMENLAPSTVHERITAEIERTVSPFREQYRLMELQRLDGMSRRVLDLMTKPRYLLHNGEVVQVEEQPVEDAGFVLACIDRLVKLQERRARLEGLDAAPRTEGSVVEVVPEDIEVAVLIRKARQRAEEQQAMLRARE